MNNLPRELLKDLINRDRLIYNDPKRCEAILLDLCGQYRKEINVIVGAIKERIPTDLLNSQSSIPPELLSARLTKRLEDNLCMNQAAAQWAVESWEFALGIKSEQALATPINTLSLIGGTPPTLPAQLLPPVPDVRPRSLIRFITTPLIVLFLSPFIFGSAALGPILPLVTLVWLWRGKTFIGNKKKIAIGITGVILVTIILVMISPEPKYYWVINIIGAIALIASLPTKNGKIVLGMDSNKS